MLKDEHTDLLERLNAELSKLPACNWKGKKVVTSGIICDNPKLLQIFDDNKIAIVADDVAHESRPCLVDAAETGDPMMALAQQFANQDYDVCCTMSTLTRTAVASLWSSWSRTPALRVWSCSCSSSATPRRWSIPT